ncbi:MAG: hypothetical protein P8163_05690 [Candidatus Thiodiazotropha sp.]
MGRQIDLLLPGLFWDTALKQFNGQDCRPKKLERVLSKAKTTVEPSVDLTTTLFKLFGITAESGRDLPSGAVTAFQVDQQPRGGNWALATPVHLLADRDRLILIRLDPKTIKDEYANRLISRFNTHFATEGLSLLNVAQGQWCMNLSSLPELTTSDIESVAGRHIESYMPSGRDGGYWRSLLNEIQMLLFQEELSQPAALRGDPPVNGIWLSGFGPCPEVETSYSALFGSHTLLSGFARLSKLPIRDLPDDFTDLSSQRGNIAILYTALHEAELKADISDWQTALERIEQQLSRLLDSVDTKQDQLRIYTCKGHRFNLQKRHSIIDFFKADKSLDRIMAEVNSAQISNLDF